MARAVETKRPNPCGLLVGKIQNIAGVCTGVVLIIAGSLALRAARKIKRGRRLPYVCPPRFRGKFKLSTYQAFLVAIYFILAGASAQIKLSRRVTTSARWRTLLMLVGFCTGRRDHHFRRNERLAVRRALGAVPLHLLGAGWLVHVLGIARRGLCGNTNLRRARSC